MKKYVKCKACGLIIPENKLKEHCPACGVPKMAFEAYTSPVSDKRTLILNAHLHPMIIHFPQAVSSLIFLLLLVNLAINSLFAYEITSALKVLIVLLPLVAFGGFISGLIDGKVRVKSYKPKYLRIKVVIGMLFLLLSFFLVWSVFGHMLGMTHFVVILLSGGCFICNILLGTFGSKLMNILLP